MASAKDRPAYRAAPTVSQAPDAARDERRFEGLHQTAADIVGLGSPQNLTISSSSAKLNAGAVVLAALVLRWVNRFEARVDRSGSCHLWIGGRQTRGYGWLGACRGNNSGLAHRFAWELERGPIPGDLTVDHLCNNKLCVRVDHLELVSRVENTRRRDARREGSFEVAL
jgi:hypothetical protein